MTDASLRKIAEQLMALVDELEVPATGEVKIRRRTKDDPVFFADTDLLGSLAKAMYRARRLRDMHFEKDLFGEPAWDILLDLFIQKTNEVQVSVTSLCIAACVPPTTALRWISILIEAGLIAREEDEIDKRRAFLRLSPKGEIAVRKYLFEANRHFRVSDNQSLFFREHGK